MLSAKGIRILEKPWTREELIAEIRGILSEMPLPVEWDGPKRRRQAAFSRNLLVDCCSAETLFESIHRSQPLLQVRDRVSIQIHSDSMPQLVRD